MMTSEEDDEEVDEDSDFSGLIFSRSWTLAYWPCFKPLTMR
jgi:hypothetical protein